MDNPYQLFIDTPEEEAKKTPAARKFDRECRAEMSGRMSAWRIGAFVMLCLTLAFLAWFMIHSA